VYMPKWCEVKMVSTGNQSLILWGEIIYHFLLMILKYAQFQVGLVQFVGRFGKLRIKLVYQESIWDYLLWSICLCSYAVMQHWTDLHSGPLGRCRTCCWKMSVSCAGGEEHLGGDWRRLNDCCPEVSESVTAWNEPGGWRLSCSLCWL